MEARLSEVVNRLASAAAKAKLAIPRLVAVSKERPVSDIIECYQYGQRHFGENYFDQLWEKANDAQLKASCPDIWWHFIGPLQSNKINKILRLERLYCIETIHSLELAQRLDQVWKRLQHQRKLFILIQVNTSDEPSKHGCKSSEAVRLGMDIADSCTNLRCAGFMTIGSIEASKAATSTGEANPEFQTLVQLSQEYGSQVPPEKSGLMENTNCYKWVEQSQTPLQSSKSELGLYSHVQLSMGMSDDFEIATSMGSTNVRVGSLIFGARK